MNSDHSSRDLRSFWQNQAPENLPIDLGALRRKAARFHRKTYWRNIREYVAAVIVVSAYGYYIYRFHNLTVRIGSAMIMAAALWVAYRILTKGSPAAMRNGMEGQACIDFHRAELVRQRDLLSTIWTWYLMPFIPGLTVFLAGMMQMNMNKPGAHVHLRDIAPGYGVVFGVCAATFAFMGWLNHRAARKLQSQIDALDKLSSPSS